MFRLKIPAVARAISAVPILFLLLLKPSTLLGSEVVSLVKTSVMRAQAIQTESEWLQLKQDVHAGVESLSPPERIEFLHELAMGIAQAQAPDRDRIAEVCRLLIGASDTTRQEQAQAFTRLFATREAETEFVATRLLADLDLVQMPNGDRRRDLSVYRLALEEGEGTTQRRLVSYLFQRLPIESASWFMENSELTATERTRLADELRQARQIVGSAEAPWGAGAGPALNNAEREEKLRQWIASPAWILQLLAKSLLEKYPSWQTPDLQVALQRVTAPESITLKPVPPTIVPGALNSTATPRPITQPVTSSQSVTPGAQTLTAVIERKWPAMVVVAVIGLLWVLLKKRK